MNDNNESFRGRLVDAGIAILGILFLIFAIIAVLCLVALFNFIYWETTFELIEYNHIIAGLFVGVLSICLTLAIIVSIVTFVVWLFRDKSKGGLSK